MGTRYTVSFRGSTVTYIAPHDSSAHVYPMYLGQDTKAKKTPMRTVTRFVPDRVIGSKAF